MATLELPGLYVDTVAAQLAGARPILINRDPGPGEIGHHTWDHQDLLNVTDEEFQSRKQRLLGT